MDELLKAVISGVVEGLTEFIPVSSTGHLILLGEIIKFTGEKAKVFEVFIQLGAIFAAFVLYFRRFSGFLDFSSTEKFRGWDGIVKLGVACGPAFILGFLFQKYIKEHLFNPTVVAVSLIVGGLVMIWIERRKSPDICPVIENISVKQCLQIGFFQALAMCPGVSRSGATIVGGMLCGLSRSVAAEFSFLAAVPLLAVAGVYDLLKHRELFSYGDVPLLAVGLLVSFITGALAIRVLVTLLSKGSLKPFGIYRIILGSLVLVLLS